MLQFFKVFHDSPLFLSIIKIRYVFRLDKNADGGITHQEFEVWVGVREGP